MALSDRDIAIAKGMLLRGDKQQHIAAYFDVNAGRIAEINTGLRGQTIDAITDDLPPPGLPKATPRDPRDGISVALDDAAIKLALYVDLLQRAKPRDEDQIQDVRATLTRVHTAILERRHELYGRRES